MIGQVLPNVLSNQRQPGKDFVCLYYQQPGHKAYRYVCPMHKQSKVTGACYLPTPQFVPDASKDMCPAL